ncbi:uncharacterized protein LOC141886126 isoform X2 [Acropora palmata]|uniref:uncharacterized protein LOC141886126 isoform X2 n=1 Tax=Acropora palmata TaxID=6131 RepID=UPI003DA183B3
MCKLQAKMIMCSRLGLSSLAYLWRRDQQELLSEMISSGIEAVLIKVAAMDLSPHHHLGLSISEVYSLMCKLKERYGSNICGEGGEYETFTLDCPLFKKKIVIDESEIIIHSDDAYAPVGFLHFKKMHLEDKEEASLQSCENLRCEESLEKLKIQTDNWNCIEIASDDTKVQRVTCTVPQRSQNFCNDSVGHSRSGDYIWVSGIYGQSTAKGKPLLIEDITRNVLHKLTEILNGLKADFHDAMIVHLFVKDMNNFAKVNSIYKSMLAVNPPARACIQLNLPENIAVQVDCLVHSPQTPDATVREAMHVQSISHWAPANIGPYSQATKAGGTIFVSGSIALFPPTMTIISGGISQEAPLALQHVGRVISAMSPGESLRSIVHGYCFLTSPSFVPVAKSAWSQATISEDGKQDLPSPVGVMSYVIVPALPKGALVEWHIVAQENQIQCNDVSSSVSRGSFLVDVQGINVKGTTNNSIAVNFAVDSDSTECHLVEIVETFTSEIRCCTSQYGFDITDLIYVRIFYVKDLMDHWDSQDCIQSGLNRGLDSVIAFSLIPVDGLEMENTIMLFSCFLQKSRKKS